MKRYFTYFAMLKGAHCSSVDIEVGVDLDTCDSYTATTKHAAKTGDSYSFSEAGYNST